MALEQAQRTFESDHLYFVTTFHCNNFVMHVFQLEAAFNDM